MDKEKIQEQIKAIRREAAWVHGMTDLYGADNEKILCDAADTIAELFAKLEAITADDQVSYEKLSRLNGWIPCSTENPKKDGFYVTALRDATGIIIEDIGFFTLAYGWEKIIPGYEVIAWNSWVEPYKEVEDNE